jgi:hypothetical protein
MAENETLDLHDRHSGRWRQLLKKIERNETADRIATETVLCLYKTFKNLVELLPLDKLLDAAKLGRDKLREVVRQCHKARDYAELFAQQAPLQTDPSKLIEGVARATVVTYFDRFGREVIGRGNWPDIARFRVLREDVSNLMRNDVERLARNVSDHPTEKPRMPARSPSQKEEEQNEILGISLRPSRYGTHG